MSNDAGNVNFNNGFVVVRKIISDDIQNLLVESFRILYNVYKPEKTIKIIVGKPVSEFYGLVPFESLLLQLKPIIEKSTGKKLLPTYSIVRLYNKGNELLKHVDRPSCEYSMSICLKSDGVLWPFNIKGKDNINYQVNLKEKDAIIYNGDLCHWRDEYNGNEQIQCFLHYVNANGPNKNFIYDRRKALGFSFSNE